NISIVEATLDVYDFVTAYDTQMVDDVNVKGTPTLVDPDFVGEEDKYVQTALDIADVSESVLMDEANPFFSSEMVPEINGFISNAANDKAPDIQTFLDKLQKKAEKWSEKQ